MGAVRFIPLEEVGPEFNKIRKHTKGMNLDEMKESTGHCKAQIIALEKGVRPFTTAQLNSFSEALGVKVFVAIAMNDDDMKRLIEINQL